MNFPLVALIAGMLLAVAAAAPSAKRQTSSCTANEINSLSDLTAQFEGCRAATCGSQSACDCCSDQNTGSSPCCNIYRSGVALRQQCMDGSGNMRRQTFHISLFNCDRLLDLNIGRDGAVTSSLNTGALGLCAVLFIGAKLIL